MNYLEDIGLDDNDFSEALLMPVNELLQVRAAHEVLSIGEEGRLQHLVHAVDVLLQNMNTEDAIMWLRSPSDQLDGKKPLEMLGPEVEKLLP